MVDYRCLKHGCLARGEIYEDPIFPAQTESVGPEIAAVCPGVSWKRPRELSKDPRFIDVSQESAIFETGTFGSESFVTAVAVLTSYPALLRQVVPTDQNFSSRYAGIFRFNLWRWGSWQEVTIDDKLPVDEHGRVLFSHDRSSGVHIFWVSLLEKAFAKLHRSYGALKNLSVGDFLTDMTGGVCECLKTHAYTRQEILEYLTSTMKMLSLVVCTSKRSTSEGSDPPTPTLDGLLRTVDEEESVFIVDNIIENENKTNSPNAEHRIIFIVRDLEGQTLRMPLATFRRRFENMVICRLPSTDHDWKHGKKTHCIEQLRGKWAQGVSAGGALIHGVNEPLYWRNPQYRILIDPTDVDETGHCSVVLSLVQIDRRDPSNPKGPPEKRKSIGIDVFLVADQSAALRMDSRYDNRVLSPVISTDGYETIREVVLITRLLPGTYCIVPSTLEPNLNGDFLLRVLTEKRTKCWRITKPV